MPRVCGYKCTRCGTEDESEFGKNKGRCLKCRKQVYFNNHFIKCSVCGIKYLANGAKEFCSNECKIKGMTEISSNGCWIWIGDQNREYGRTVNYLTGRREQAHRLSYETFVAKIPEGMVLCHNCPGGDNKLCVNPNHLFIGTHSDNNTDTFRKSERFKKWRYIKKPREKQERKTLNDFVFTKSVLSEYRNEETHKILKSFYENVWHE